MNTEIRTVTVTGLGDVPVTFTERGSGQPVLLLHGGAGAFSDEVSGISPDSTCRCCSDA